EAPARLIRREAFGDARPRLARIARAEHVRRVVAESVESETGGRFGGVEVRRLDAEDFGALHVGNSGDARVGPRLAGVVRDLDQPIVGADPDRARADSGRAHRL